MSFPYSVRAAWIQSSGILKGALDNTAYVACIRPGHWGFQEALLLKGLIIVFKDHGNAPFVSFDVIFLTRTCHVDPV
jgi:hypothetical protein